MGTICSITTVAKVLSRRQMPRRVWMARKMTPTYKSYLRCKTTDTKRATERLRAGPGKARSRAKARARARARATAMARALQELADF